ncbi:MAG: dihydrofolate reductase region, partial [Herbinix sp.]|nr:dihydrofolate reductase region [Herbinix sp.]
MLALIAALSKNYVIGNQGVIPWKIKGEQKRFKELTTGNTVIMGKRSFEEIGKPLPNRKTIVISNTTSYEYENCITLGSLAEAIAYVGEGDAFVA